MRIAIYLLIIAALAFHVFISPLVKRNAEKKVSTIYYILNAVIVIIAAVLLFVGIGQTELFMADSVVNNLIVTTNQGHIPAGLATVALFFVLNVIYYRKGYFKYKDENRKIQHLKDPNLLAMFDESEEKLKLSKKAQANVDSEHKKLASIRLDLENIQKQVQADRQELESLVEVKVHERTNQIALEEKAKYDLQVEQLQLSYSQKMEAYIGHMEQRLEAEKERVISNVFSFDEKDQDDIFELKRKKESLSKKEEELEKNRFLLDVDKKVSEASKHVIEAKHSALEVKSENVDLRADLRILSSEFKSDLQKEQSEREQSFQSLQHGLESQNIRLQSDMKGMSSDFTSRLQKEEFERKQSNQSLEQKMETQHTKLESNMKSMSSDFKSDLQKEQFEREKANQSLQHGLESQNAKLQSEMKGMSSDFKSDLQKEQFEREKANQSLKHGQESQQSTFEWKLKEVNNDLKGDLQKEQFEREKLNQSLKHGLESQDMKFQAKMKDMASALDKEQFARERAIQALQQSLDMESLKRASEYKDMENKLALFREQVGSRFTELTSLFTGQLKDLEVKTKDSFLHVQENMSNMKLQFGQEIIRLDDQQGKIVNELEKYHAKNQTFVNQMQSLALEAKRQNIEGDALLNKVNLMHQQHQLECKSMEQNMHLSLEKISVQEARLANSMGESMLKLKNISDQQVIAMKDMALEQKGIEVLWREKGIEHDMNLQKVDFEKKSLEHTKQLLQQEKANFQQNKSNATENLQLRHQMYMREEQLTQALSKAQNSGGLLTRIGRWVDSRR